MTFKSFLSTQLEAFVQYRTSLGYKNIVSLKSYLKKFDRYIIETGEIKTFSPSFFLEFKKNLTVSPDTNNKTLFAVRRFYDYLIRINYIDFNPLQDLPPEKERTFIPFIFSRKETDRILHTVQHHIRHDEACFFKDMMVYAAIMLLARCGMRISEPVRLHINHYRLCDRTIYIEKTKFSKDRLIAVPKMVANELNHYLAVRKAFFNGNNSSLFPNQTGGNISSNRIYPVFHRAVAAAGLNDPSRVIGNMRFGGPCPHSFRHSFAVNTLKAVKERGNSPQQTLPVLSAYMGHSLYKDTAVYLKVLDADHRRSLKNINISQRNDI
ncbi:MAG: tyrosine-type recombinase/integrase [Desulfobacteraceae bacterium]|nr:tyrosine-type recombinase/integrase [Desulfobacteraceae bacterium]